MSLDTIIRLRDAAGEGAAGRLGVGLAAAKAGRRSPPGRVGAVMMGGRSAWPGARCGPYGQCLAC